MDGYIYCLRNESLKDGIVKIGYTKDISRRINTLWTTGVAAQRQWFDDFVKNVALPLEWDIPYSEYNIHHEVSDESKNKDI